MSYWYLVAPAEGTDTITVTYSHGEQAEKGGFSISLTGVNQSTPIGNTIVGTAFAAAMSTSLNLTTTANDSYVFDVLKVRPGGVINATTSSGAGQTSWGLGSSTTGTSYEAAGVAPDVRTMSWDWSPDTVDGVQSAIEILAAAESSGAGGRLPLLGVG